MAETVEYIELDPGTSGEKVATDLIGGIHHQRTKMQFGADGTALDVEDDMGLPVRVSSAGAQQKLLSRFLDTVGDGSGTKEGISDYSSTPGILRIAPGAGEVFRIARLIVSIEDTAGFAATGYGDVAGELTNGITVRVHDGTSLLMDLTDGVPLVSNADWSARCYDADVKTWGSGNDLLAVRWTFTKSGQYIRLDGDESEEFQVYLNDDFTGLVSHRFLIQGYVEGVWQW